MKLNDGMYAKNYYENYSFEIIPTKYGEHLIKCWNFLRDQSLFNPWYHNKSQNLIVNESLLEINYLHEKLVALLKAKEIWHKIFTLMKNSNDTELLNSCKANLIFASNLSDPNYSLKENYTGLSNTSTWVDLSNNHNDWINQLIK